ncbi:MAG: ATP-dependent DNA helicase, partial [Nanoarchaeota archaeon]|nr:ATP-dependent DNA helicase [Nanoarchaeota archaeon]
MKDDFLFPYDKIRKIQEDMLKDVADAVKNKKKIIAHAPTGLGKTIASLGPALKHAIDNDLTVFFLTSRHTQHNIAIETLAEIKRKYDIDFSVADIIGKRWMCAMDGVHLLSSKDFSTYCKSVKEDGKCEFYSRTKKGNVLTTDAKKVLEDLKNIEACSTEKLIEMCKKNGVCPYEMAMTIAAKAKVIICDYFFVFDKGIRETFMSKTNNKIEESILIIDEGHNLPSRIRDLATSKLSSFVLKRAIKEAKKFGYNDTIEELSLIQDILNSYGEGMSIGAEKILTKEDFMNRVSKIKDYDQIVGDLAFIGEEVREKQRQSYIGSVALFLEHWPAPDQGSVRIFSVSQFKNQPSLNLIFRCLDPSVFSNEVIEKAYSAVLMSGTLTPTSMYKDLLGFPKDTVEKIYENPFYEENKLTLIIPETTTKFNQRNEQQFQRIAKIISEIVNLVPGNSAIFFPSYGLRDQVYKYFYDLCEKTTFKEQPGMTKEEKTDFLERFKGYQKTGAVLLGASTGSFGEGVDLPGDLLKAVIVVGLP